MRGEAGHAVSRQGRADAAARVAGRVGTRNQDRGYTVAGAVRGYCMAATADRVAGVAGAPAEKVPELAIEAVVGPCAGRTVGVRTWVAGVCGCREVSFRAAAVTAEVVQLFLVAREAGDTLSAGNSRTGFTAHVTGGAGGRYQDETRHAAAALAD
jgi:hypothetical protein